MEDWVENLNQNSFQGPMNKSVLFLFFLWIFATCFWWGFAFLKLPGPTPEWLLEAQVVCFGETATGLPDADGWRALVFPPLFMIVSLVFVFFQDLKTSLETLLHSNFGRVAAITIVGLIAIEGALIVRTVVNRWPISENTVANSVNLPLRYPKTEIKIEDFDLINQNESKFGLKDLKGKKSVLTFAFANCDSICPLVVKNCVEAVREFEEKDFQLVIVTLDPWRDSPSRLRAAIKMWEATDNTHFLSGEVKQVEEVLKSFNVAYDRNEKTGFISHPGLVYVVNEDGRISYSFNNPSRQWLKDALNRL